MNAIIESLNAGGVRFTGFALPMLLQSAVLIALLFALDLILRKRVRATIRYAVWMLLLVKLALPPSLALPTAAAYWLPSKTARIYSAPPVAPGAAMEQTPANTAYRPSSASQVAAPLAAELPALTWQAVLFVVWLAVASGAGIWVLWRLRMVVGMIRRSVEAPEAVRILLESCSQQFGIKSAIPVRCAPIGNPAICGLLRPIILIPPGLADDLDSSEMRSVLLHELAHYKRGDLWVHHAQILLQIFYWYNPLLWLANGRIRRAREQAVDETVLVEMGVKAQAYSAMLLHVAKLRLGRPMLAMGLMGILEPGRGLTQRILHIFSRPLPRTARMGVRAMAAVLLLALVALPMACRNKTQPPSQTAVSTNAPSNAAAQQSNCAGTVTDADGHPLAGATVEYWLYGGNPFTVSAPDLKGHITTKADGAFQFQVATTTAILLAHKPGLAPAWKQVNGPFGSAPDTEEKLVLTPPVALTGIVVDQDDKPVANAFVSVSKAYNNPSQEEGYNPLVGKPAIDCFAVHTDAQGSFRIENFPASARAWLAVRAPGKALREPGQNSLGWQAMPWHAGQKDIKLVLELAGSIDGRVVVEGSNQPPPPSRLRLEHNGSAYIGAAEFAPTLPPADGSFHFSDLSAGSYSVHAAFLGGAAREWVTDPLNFSVQSGQTASNVQVIATHGGFLETLVLRESDRKPLPQTIVHVSKLGLHSSAPSDSNGITRMRLPPGEYRYWAGVNFMPPNAASASVEFGKTNRIEIEVAAPKMIAGIVRQPDGKPAAGVQVRLVGVYGPDAAKVRTDAGGKFQLEWKERQNGRNNPTACVLVRDVDHNLAAAEDIDEDTGPLDLKLAPGLTLAGRAECDGKPVANTTAMLMFWTGNRGMGLAGLNPAANAQGRFEIPALPLRRKYGLSVSAKGYGQGSINSIDSSEAGRVELDPIELKLAKLKLAGQVLDADDNPVAGAYVNLYGAGQPNDNKTTDSKGQFRFESVCEGVAQISANSQNSFGNVSAQGGDTNVVLRLGQNQSFNSDPDSKPHKLKGTVTDADGKPAPGAQVAMFPDFQFNGSHWTKTAANGAYSLTWSLQPWQRQQGGAEILVARDPARNLAATEEAQEETTNLDVKLKPALTVTGIVNDTNDAPLAGAEVGVWFKAGNNYSQFDERTATSDAKGRYEIKCLPQDGSYIVFASANGHGRNQQTLSGDSETNRVELSPFVLKLADHVLAGQVLDDKDKPVSGANVSLSDGDGQPNGNMTTDSKGRFHFKVCEGTVRLFANGMQGGGFAQATAEAGDTNVIMNLSSQPGIIRQAQHHASLKGAPLPDLSAVNLPTAAAPNGQPVLLCLFDAGQRSSRHIVSQLNEQSAALRQQGVTVLGIQAALTTDDILNAWKTANPVTFPLGRVTDKSANTKWASTLPALPWLILADAHHQVIAEGFPLDDLDAQIKKLPK